MTKDNLFGTPAQVKNLAARLAQCEDVRKFDRSASETEAPELAYALAGIEESCRKVIEEHMPRLATEALNPEECSDALGDLAEELRHILYHIWDSKFFGYLTENPSGR